MPSSQQARIAESGTEDRLQTLLLRLENFRVLDPACGSGNFLYLSLHALREVEKRARVEAEALGLHTEFTLHTGPHNILGLEINEFAAELARVSIWIGDIQWSRRNGYPHAINPILKPLGGIEQKDALLDADGNEAQWPEADVIIGNPPFLGDKMMRGKLGDEYVNALRKTYEGRVPGGTDLVCYWFEKALYRPDP
ncbi:MAG: N-6 DNA methylase [Zoogloeaceae bacterium]|nr:N-6 DNA methylase [Zoogloeaceae bacterium]